MNVTDLHLFDNVNVVTDTNALIIFYCQLHLMYDINMLRLFEILFEHFTFVICLLMLNLSDFFTSNFVIMTSYNIWYCSLSGAYLFSLYYLP